jgi:hypothetical protein
MILSLHEFLCRQIPYLFYYRKTPGICHRILFVLQVTGCWPKPEHYEATIVVGWFYIVTTSNTTSENFSVALRSNVVGRVFQINFLIDSNDEE